MSKQIFTKEQKKKYLHDAFHCPVCGSEDFGRSELTEVDDRNARAQVRCGDCGSEWTDVFTLSDIEPIQLAELPGKTKEDGE